MTIRFQYRLSKYDPRLRDSSGSYLGDEWSGPHQLGEEIAGVKLTPDILDETINRYLYVIEAFAGESDVRQLTVIGLNEGAPRDRYWAEVGEGSVVSVHQAIDLVGSELRGAALGAALEDADRFYVHVSDYMYVYLGSHVECPAAVAEAQRVGLFAELGHPSPFVDDGDRFWWLPGEGAVYHILMSTEPTTGRTVERLHIPDDKVAALRALYVPNPEDNDFWDRYPVDGARWNSIQEILGVTLDPRLEHDLWTTTRL